MSGLINRLKFINQTVYVPGQKSTIRLCQELYLQTIAQQAAKSPPDEVGEAYTFLMNSSFELGDITAAIDYAAQGLSLKPCARISSVLLTNQAVGYALQDNYALAEKAARLAVTLSENEEPRIRESCAGNLEAIVNKTIGPIEHIYLQNE